MKLTPEARQSQAANPEATEGDQEESEVAQAFHMGDAAEAHFTEVINTYPGEAVTRAVDEILGRGAIDQKTLERLVTKADRPCFIEPTPDRVSCVWLKLTHIGPVTWSKMDSAGTSRNTAFRLSYADRGSYAKNEPLHATRFMACSGGGWIVTGLVVRDRFRV